MSTRLQILLPDRDYREVKAAAKKSGVTVSAWVRQALALAHKHREHKSAADKREALYKVLAVDVPSVDIDQMLEEIDGGALK
jgi:hypothetical protein